MELTYKEWYKLEHTQKLFKKIVAYHDFLDIHDGVSYIIDRDDFIELIMRSYYAQEWAIYSDRTYSS